MNHTLLVSAHGGHSGEFCCHAQDTLEDVLAAYISKGFEWVGITEHMPAVNDRFVYPDERTAGLNAASIQQRFNLYFETALKLRTQLAGRIDILIGFETEYYAGAEKSIRSLVEYYRPDYLVGSLHHVSDMEIDYTRSQYLEAVNALGGIIQLYNRYFDEQYDMISSIKPAVVGHFDLIRIFDHDYLTRLKIPSIWHKVLRNLDLIKELDLILDFNLAGYNKTAAEPYPTREVLKAALERGIAIVPGDDSHGVSSVGQHFKRGVELLSELGADLNWQRPRLYQWEVENTDSQGSN